MSATTLDDYLSMLMKKELLNEDQIQEVYYISREILINESNVQQIAAPVTVCGDIHGQFYDLLELFLAGGNCPVTNYLFLGDYVDRGYDSVETILLLLTLKCRYPDRITLIRGNHESRQITSIYGFYDECIRKFGNANVWRIVCDLFDLMPIGATINNEILCVHGGLSPAIQKIDHIRLIDRKVEVPQSGPFSDLLWSDPSDEEKGWRQSSRGAGYVFGEDVTKKFLHQNKIQYIARAHQLVMEGYKEHFNGQVVTIWSAPNYCYRCGNVASILQLDEHLKKEYIIFKEAPENVRNTQTKAIVPEYFL